MFHNIGIHIAVVLKAIKLEQANVWRCNLSEIRIRSSYQVCRGLNLIKIAPLDCASLGEDRLYFSSMQYCGTAPPIENERNTF